MEIKGPSGIEAHLQAFARMNNTQDLNLFFYNVFLDFCKVENETWT